MPLSLVPEMVLRETISPSASNDTTADVAIFGKDVAGDVARHLFDPDAVAAAGRDLAIGDADVAAAEAMHQAAPCRQGNAAAVERDTGQADAVGAFAQKHRSAAIEHKFGRAANADQLRSALQVQHAGAVDTRRQRQRHLRARGLVDRALQILGLVVGTARAARHIAWRRDRAPTSGVPRARHPVDIASAPATPAADAPMRWRRLTSMMDDPAFAYR